MNKKIIIILGIIVGALIIIGLGIWYFANNRNITQTPVESNLQKANFPGSAIKEGSGDTVVWQTENGPVTMSNIFNQAVKYNEYNNPVSILLNNSVDFSLSYQYSGDYILIELLKSPYSTSRNSAEQILLSTLNISKTDACKLPIDVTIPGQIHSGFTDGSDYVVSYGLSFCSNGTKLP